MTNSASFKTGIKLFLCIACGLISTTLALISAAHDASQPTEADVVIYGATSAGIAAAVQVKRMGKTVLVIEPSKRVGGLTTGGLGQTDIGNKAAIGGISREFYQRVRAHYQKEESWRWQKKSEYRSGGQSKTSADEDAMWTFEPSVALRIMNDFVKENEIPVLYGERVDRSTKTSGVVRKGRSIATLQLESGRKITGRMFIDATYEGDLMAAAGVNYTYGREANSRYGETLNGVQTKRATKHQLAPRIDPYRIKGDSASGLLPGIDPNGPGKEGSSDRRIQAYCYRMCLTDHPENRIPFQKPIGYDELEYELLFRNFEAGAKVIPWSHSLMPNRKSDTNNNRGFSTDFIGQNYDYPEATYAEREKIVERHRVYQQGLMWTLAYHRRTPEFVKKVISRWGTCRDEFGRNDGWQQQLYIRESRRMIGGVVMTQHHCQGNVKATKPIGLAAYTMDSHNVQRHINKDGFVRNEGDVQVGGFSPYAIDYHSITPKPEQCANLLVPVCLSASHIAFGSIRMEPVFMVLGQSAATASVQAIDQNTSVQKVNYDLLKQQLEKDKQRLVWTGPVKKRNVGIPLNKLKGIIQDESVAILTGFDAQSQSQMPFLGLGYRHDSNSDKGNQSAVFVLKLPTAGRYRVQMSYSSFSNRATNVPVLITHKAGDSKINVNQRKPPSDSPFETLGEFDFDKKAKVVISNKGTDGFVIIDSIRLLPVQASK